MLLKKYLTALSVVIAAGFLVSCASTPPTNFYVLTPITETPGDAQSELTLGIGPIRIPNHLDRPHIVTRSGPNQLQLADFHHWAEPLNKNIARVLAENLAILVPSEHVVLLPQAGRTVVDYRVAVDITRFDTASDDHCHLTARWSISGAKSRDVMVRRTSAIKESIAGDSYGERLAASQAGDQSQDNVQHVRYAAMAAAQSRALGTLSREIADAIRALPATEKTAAEPAK